MVNDYFTYKNMYARLQYNENEKVSVGNRGLGRLEPRSAQAPAIYRATFAPTMVGGRGPRPSHGHGHDRLSWSLVWLRLAWLGFESGLDQSDLDHEVAGQTFERGAQSGEIGVTRQAHARLGLKKHFARHGGAGPVGG